MDTIPDTRGDHYIELMRDSRHLSSAQNELRELWFNGLELNNKEEVLFELEMLLKGLVCFGDLKNHPGPKNQAPVESRQFRKELKIVELVCERITELCELLVSSEGEPTSSDIYLVGGPLEAVSRPLVDEPFEQETPDSSLKLLLHAFSDLTDVVGVMGRLERIPFRGFTGTTKTSGREIARNVFFNPLMSLEFRSEYDHLQHIEILHIVYGGGPEGAQRAATLCFLSIFRMLRYIRYVESYADDVSSAGIMSIPLSIVRSDGRALAKFMRSDATNWLSDGFEREVMTLSAKEIVAASEGLVQDYYVLNELGATLRSIGDQLHLELRRTFEQLLEPLPELLETKDLATKVKATLKELRDYLMLAVVRIAQVFKPNLDGPQIFDEFIDEVSAQERRRREIWMFSQIMRGFLAKAAAAPETANRWSGNSSYIFVREFIAYFRNIGYQLLRASDYEKADEFMKQVETLSAADVIDQDAVEVFARECDDFRSYLLQSFKKLGESAPLTAHPFDRHATAETLRLYLDRG